MPGAVEHLLIGQHRLRCRWGLRVMGGLGAELAILATSSDLRGDDRAELYVPPDVADANLVGPVEQVVDIVPADAGEVFGVGPVEAPAVQNPIGQPCNLSFHLTSVRTCVRATHYL